MHIEHDKSLKPYNTFGIDETASEFVSIKSVDMLKDVIGSKGTSSLFVLGGGSNMLLTKPVSALVLHIAIKGIEVVEETDDEVVIRAMAGENWHEFVLHCIRKGYGGIENLSLIPGNTGAAPIQNIGAYGVELKDVFESCDALEIASNQIRTFHREDCKFGYRSSVFKTELKNKYIIVSVSLRLTKRNHRLETSYGAIRETLHAQGIDKPGIEDISNTVIQIRRSKLPDPAILGNSGSFFKNPVIGASDFARFREDYPDAPFYKISDSEYKIPAGWLIETAGFKGLREGDAGIHDRQALVLVNHGNASGKALLALSEKVQHTVKKMFGISLEREVNVF